MSETHGAGEQGFARFLPADPRVAPTAGAQVRPAQAASAPPARRPPPHLTRGLLAHESRGRLLGQAALVQPQPLHVAVGGDTLSLSGALHLLDLHPDNRSPGARRAQAAPSVHLFVNQKALFSSCCTLYNKLKRGNSCSSLLLSHFPAKSNP